MNGKNGQLHQMQMIYRKTKSGTKSRLGSGVKLGQIEVKTRSNNDFTL